MGCLNSNENFQHWFGNIHLSGPCNRSCYFCIGQFMPAIDKLNNLSDRPLKGIEGFISRCLEKNITEVNLTGTNTDPLLYLYHDSLTEFLRTEMIGVKLGIRTNGVFNTSCLIHYDNVSVSVTSFDDYLYRATMGRGNPPDIERIAKLCYDSPTRIKLKVNVVLCNETVESGDIFKTLDRLVESGVKTVNLREPYGQPHIGSPIGEALQVGVRFGMPFYNWKGIDVTYWDVHHVEVESVNLYANGHVSTTYPITKGHAPDGTVYGQDHWKYSGRKFQQWI